MVMAMEVLRIDILHMLPQEGQVSRPPTYGIVVIPGLCLSPRSSVFRASAPSHCLCVSGREGMGSVARAVARASVRAPQAPPFECRWFEGHHTFRSCHSSPALLVNLSQLQKTEVFGYTLSRGKSGLPYLMSQLLSVPLAPIMCRVHSRHAP